MALKVKDWLKEQSEKQFIIVDPSHGCVKRIKDNLYFLEKQFVGYNGNVYKIVGFDENNIHVYMTRGEINGTVEINDLQRLFDVV